MKNEQHPLVALYGEKVFDMAHEKIQELAKSSNFKFDNDYLDLATSLVVIKSEEIIEGKKEKCSLSSLVSESFGEAAIYQFQLGVQESE